MSPAIFKPLQVFFEILDFRFELKASRLFSLVFTKIVDNILTIVLHSHAHVSVLVIKVVYALFDCMNRCVTYHFHLLYGPAAPKRSGAGVFTM